MTFNTMQEMAPELRLKSADGNPFPDWVEDSFVNRFEIGSGRDYKHLGLGEIPVFGSSGEVMTYVDSSLHVGESVGIGRKGTIDKPVRLSGSFWTVDTLFYMHQFNEVQVDFLYQIFLRVNWRRYNEATGVPSLSKKTIESIRAFFPCLPEQERISEFLVAVDDKIAKLKRKKVLLEEYKKGVMQKLFSQEIRFKDEDGNDFPDWENRRMGDFLSEHGEKSKGNEPVFSVSVHKGLVDQIEHLGRSFAAADTSHYNRVNPDDVVYTKSPTGDFPYGIVKRNQSGVAAIVSPLYGVFEPESKGLGIWLNEYFSSTANTHNYLHSIIQKGAKNTINITNRTFLSKALKVPSDFEEQTKIGQCFSEMNHRIDSLAEQINKAQDFKRGLLQKMFV